MKELIEVLRVQKHDFLNHLQVISGYLQLNKAERAKEYIQQVSQEIYHSGTLTKLKVPEVALNLMILKNEATNMGVNLDISMETDLAGSTLSGERLGSSIYKLVGIALEQAGKSGIANPFCQVRIMNHHEQYCIKVVFPGQDAELVENYVDLENRSVIKDGGAMVFKANSPIEMEIIIQIPKA